MILPRLENWSIVQCDNYPYLAPELRAIKLCGEIYDDERYFGGKRIQTSRLTEFNVEGKYAKTYSGTYYDLGEIDPAYEKWLKSNNKALVSITIGVDDTSIESEMWNKKWLQSFYTPFIEIEKGETIQTYRNNFNKGIIKSLSFFTEWEGYKVVCVNQGSTNSQIFDSVDEDYDIMAPFSFNGSEWRVSLYTKKDIDVSAIAVKYGGGGHAQAAGFRCKELPFRKD